jgi:hypothetical protein
MGDFVHAGDSKIARCAVNDLACTVEFVAGISGLSDTQNRASTVIESQSQFYTQGAGQLNLLPYEYSQQIRLNENGFVQGPQSQTGATEADVLAGRQNTVSQASRIHGSGSAGH